MIAGLKDRFIPEVESGKKRHTIRRGKRWRAGMRIDLFANVRQKTMHLIFRAPVTCVEDIVILVGSVWFTVYINDHALDQTELVMLAIRDGFKSAADMHAFWLKQHGLGSFDGQIVHWDYERRTNTAPGRTNNP